MVIKSNVAAPKAKSNAKAKGPTIAERIRSGTTKARGKAHKLATDDKLDFDSALLAYTKKVGEGEVGATAMAMRMFIRFDNWNPNDPNSAKPKVGASWVAAIAGSAYSDNEKARKAALNEVKAQMREAAILHSPSNVNAPWSRMVAAAKALLGGNANSPLDKTSNDKAHDKLKSLYRMFAKDERLNEEGLDMQRMVAAMLTRFWKEDLSKLG